MGNQKRWGLFARVVALALAAFTLAGCGESRGEDEAHPAGAWRSVRTGTEGGWSWELFEVNGSDREDRCVAASVSINGQSFDAVHPTDADQTVDGEGVPLGLPEHRGRGYTCFSRDAIESDPFDPFYLAIELDQKAAATEGLYLAVAALPERVKKVTVEVGADRSSIATSAGYLVVSAPEGRLRSASFKLDKRDVECEPIEGGGGQFGCEVGRAHS